ncbi:MAG: hypothetical protein WC867_00055 [Candidatus Pacearchaeota archaeon]|jgi:hypothetical protein
MTELNSLLHPGINHEHPIYNGEMDKICEILQGEFGTTDYNNETPVLATVGIGPCLGIAGYEKDKKIGFLGHFDNGEHMNETLSRIYYAIGSNTLGEKSKFDLTILRGYDYTGNESTKTLDYLKRFFDAMKNHSMEFNIIHEDLGPNFGRINSAEDRFEEREKLTKTLLIDSRDGKIYRYDITKNPYTLSNRFQNSNNLEEKTMIINRVNLAFNCIAKPINLIIN